MKPKGARVCGLGECQNMIPPLDVQRERRVARGKRAFGSAQRYCCARHRHTAANRRARAREPRRNHIYLSAVLGRVCSYCGAGDDERRRFANVTTCENCYRQMRTRPRCGVCGGPFYVVESKRWGRPVGCPRCNAEAD